MKKLTLLLLLSIFVLSCKNEDDFMGIVNDHVVSVTDEQFAQDNFGQVINSNFIGRIVNQAGNTLKDVQITIGNQTTMTDHNGVFVLNNASVHEKFAFVKATKNGYIQGSRSLVPTPNGTNDIQITLLDKNIVGTVNSGEISEAVLPNGAKLQFQGDFIDASGNAYNGQVEVSLNYLEPNQQSTFVEMPGMLFGQLENGASSGMETYGMLAVNLYSPSGEKLNITETAPANLTFPVSTTTPNAPSEIALWYFDETVGYWKEQGIAIRVGDKYHSEVTHFTWWNCDLPLDYVEVCFTVKSHDDLTNYYYDIIRNETNQMIFTGYTNDQGQECGLIPSGEELTVNVYGTGACINSIVYTQTIGPYTNDTSIDIIVPSLPSQLIETALTGTVSTCTGTSVTNGYVLLYNSASSNFSDYEMLSIADGIINYPFSYCNGEQYSMIVYDLDSNQSSGASQMALTPTEINVGTVLVCGNQVGGGFVGDVVLRSQEEVDLFSLLGFHQINGDLIIGDEYGMNTNPNTSSLLSLNNLTSISGDLSINNNDFLNSLEGLQNINSVGGSLNIGGNEVLSSITVLGTIEYIGNNLGVGNNPNLSSLEGLESITSITGSLNISGEAILSLVPLSNITSVGGGLYIQNCSVTTLEGLENITSVGGTFYVAYTDVITMTGMEGLMSVDKLSLIYNDELESLIGLENLVFINGKIKINYNDSLISFEGLSGLTAIFGSLEVGFNESLISMYGLTNVTTIEGHFRLLNNNSQTSFEGLNNLISLNSISIESNDSLASMNGFDSLTSIINDFRISGNDSLLSLTGLESLTSIGGNFGLSLTSLMSLDGLQNLNNVNNLNLGADYLNNNFPNANLSNFCSLQGLLVNGNYNDVYIENNAYNPTVQDIINGNCSQ